MSGGEFAEKDYSLVFCRREDSDGGKEILLGMKKRGFGAGKWNGFGGKVEGLESMEACAIREMKEESGLSIENIERVGYLCFKMLETSKIMRVHVFQSWTFSGDLLESDEMRPQWFRESQIPFSSMWPDDAHWLPRLLQGEKFIGRLVTYSLFFSFLSYYLSRSNALLDLSTRMMTQ